MAFKLPAIPAIEEPSELINLVANSPLYKERMTALVDIYTKIKANLEEYARSHELADTQADIAGKMAEAKRKLAEADAAMKDASQYVVDVKSKASDEIAVKFSRLANEESRIRSMGSDLAKREAALSDAEAQLDAEGAKVAEQITEAKNIFASASKLQREYESKLAQLKAMV